MWRKERSFLGWGSRRAGFGGAARAAHLPAASSQVRSRKLCQHSTCGAEQWLIRELIQVKNNSLGLVGGTQAQLQGTAGGIEWSGEVESGGSCLGYQPPSEEIPKAQPVLMWSPPSSCAPDTAICSVLSLLASPLTQVLLPQLSCCWS